MSLDLLKNIIFQNKIQKVNLQILLIYVYI